MIHLSARTCHVRTLLAALVLAAAAGARAPDRPAAAGPAVLTGQAALGDWTTDAPGVRRRITPADLPKPYDTPSVDNGPRVIPRPAGAEPRVPPGFQAGLFAAGLSNPRALITAPNGDVFVAESRAHRVKLLRDADGDGRAELVSVFAQGLSLPFGLALYPPGPDPRYLYVGNTDSVIRLPYRAGETRAAGPAEVIVPDIPGGGQLRGGGHWTRDVAFSRDGKKLWVSVGSWSNVAESGMAIEDRRAAILEYNPDGTGYRLYASGIRNPVGLAVHPQTGELWTSVNERDGLGDHLVPDYVTSVRDGGFYGWPWYYIGPNADPRLRGQRPELRDRVIVPDVLLQSHSASLGMTFYTGASFPAAYRNDAFAAEHGSWNRSRRTGYKVIRIPLRAGRAVGEYEDFMTGLVTPEGNVWGRPVGVAVAKDGALLVSDDGGNVVWRVAYGGR